MSVDRLVFLAGSQVFARIREQEMIRKGSGRKPQFPSNELSYVINSGNPARPDCAPAAFKSPTSLEYLKVRSCVSLSFTSK